MLSSHQNGDGGWPYRNGSSWTEPTAYALLAQSAGVSLPQGFERAFDWLRANQRPDGGWAPRPSVAQSTWVTSLVALLPTDRIGPATQKRAVEWLAGQSGRESGFLHRLRLKMLGADAGEGFSGWPWYPDTAAWVSPTALSILALEKFQQDNPNPRLAERIEGGRQYLLSRVCADGGWNHGSSRALGYESNSYPETTGVVLLALHGVKSPKIPRAIETARKHLAQCRSAEGVNWLKLGLLAHGQAIDGSPDWPPRTVPESALAAIADAAGRGKNIFLGHA
jgi:hypothetical protein